MRITELLYNYPQNIKIQVICKSTDVSIRCGREKTSDQVPILKIPQSLRGVEKDITKNGVFYRHNKRVIESDFWNLYRRWEEEVSMR